ncbi:MAG: ATP-binding protein [Rhodopila sp.]
MEAQLREARDEAEAANRAKSAFLAMMSHEIRTPLNGVIGMAEVLAQDQLQQRQADAVRIIRDLALNLMTLIDDILDFSKIEAGSLGLDQTSVSVTELIEDICASLEPMALAKGVELSAIIAPQCPEWLLADPTRLRQILFNVAGNAIKFSGGQTAKRGRVTIRVDVAQAAPLQLCIRVTDNGIGMTAETQSRLYTPFTQGETSTTRRYGGTGLGLAITRRLIDMFQGTIEVDSAPGAGTTFTMVLPFEIVANRPAAVRLDLSGINCVLAWSADVPEAADLQGYLAAAGARTHIAADLPQAMALARTLTDTIVIHDATPGRAPAGDKGSGSASATARQLLLWRGQRWRAFLGPGDDIGLDLGWMRQDALLRAVAIATGRMPQDALATNSPVPTPFGAKPPPTVAEARAQGRLILLADDDEINRTVILRQLNLLGYTAETASDGWEALEKWRSGSYALLLTDVFMPNMDGYQLATAIRQEEAGGRRIPIVALSANAVRGEADKARALGVDVYLTKPILLKDLRKALQHFLPDPVSPAAVPDETPMDPDLGGEMPVFDPDTLVSLVGQDPKILSDVLSDFSRAAKQLAADLTAAVADGDAARMGAVAHKLKSSSRSVGALQLGEICATLEEAGRTGAFAAIPICMAQFAAAMAEVQAHILNHLDQTRRSTLPGAGPNANVDH